jgi:hypothetical protein
MKKTVFAVVFGVFAITTNVNAQAVQEGNVLIDAYYGFPDLYKATFRTAYANSRIQLSILKIDRSRPIGRS